LDTFHNTLQVYETFKEIYPPVYRRNLWPAQGWKIPTPTHSNPLTRRHLGFFQAQLGTFQAITAHLYGFAVRQYLTAQPRKRGIMPDFTQ
jgi:hypothetical protein